MSVSRSSRQTGFTLLELLAVIATIATLSALLFPILAKAKYRAHLTNCSSNLRSLANAWAMYNEESGGWLVQSYAVKNPNVWVQGDMTRPTEATNASLIAAGKLYPFVQSTTVYRCPADLGVPFAGEKVRSVRSYSMNSFMGERSPSIGPIPSTAVNYKAFFAKESEILQPSDLFVFIDEDEPSINDGAFVTDPSARVWFDRPSISQHRHRYSYTIAFADTHGETWKITDPRTRELLQNAYRTEQGGNPDLKRLAAAATTK
jgi:prepilin-type N-terminal cleavage/methylation domain-containing protein